MESWEAIAISQALRLGQFWHACNMPLTAHRHVNGKPLKIGINWRKFVPFHPLDLQKTDKIAAVQTVMGVSRTSASFCARASRLATEDGVIPVLRRIRVTGEYGIPS